MSLRSLYPPLPAAASGHLETGEGHSIYFETSGRPDGLPVVFLHGGPGGGCKPSHRQFFDPDRYRAVIYDQRGAGRSQPFGETRHNSTPHLVSDLERLRVHLGIDAWVLFGGSWGAALALAYAGRHPERVLGMVLRGAFLARQTDLDWFLHSGAPRLLPRAWERLNERLGWPADPGRRAYELVFGADRAVAVAAARAWAEWSGEVVMYAFDTTEAEPEAPEEEVLAKARIELHYAANRYFLRENQLMEDIERLPRVPVALVHGQRDITCTPEAAWTLYRAIPGATLEILRTTGHLSGEPAMTDALLRAADDMAIRLGRT